MKYSIIIPVYNGEETIGRCLDSILTQDHPDTEIILINDGSTDGTDSICSLYVNPGSLSGLRYSMLICPVILS